MFLKCLSVIKKGVTWYSNKVTKERVWDKVRVSVEECEMVQV